MYNIYLYNNLTRQKERFSPLNNNHIKIYVCGPTVYNDIHIGNLRPLVVFSSLVKFLRKIYPKVTYVRNITDIDDKIINKSQQEGISVSELTERETKKFHEICNLFDFSEVDYEPKVTDHLNEIIDYIKKIESQGATYKLSDGIYFDTSMDIEYGRFLKIDPTMLESRLEKNSDKKNPTDFVLWKKSTTNNYESPWGPGRPGWHIECSAMSNKYLGKVFDIHGGGSDLSFPHHENEISQGKLAYGCIMSNYWIHNGIVNINQEKMSKSLGNTLLVKDLVQNTQQAAAIKYLFLSIYYGNSLSFSEEILEIIRKNIINLRVFIEKNKMYYNSEYNTSHLISKNFYDDFNTPGVISDIHKKANNFNLNNNSEDYMFVYLNCHLLGINYEPLKKLSEENVNDLIEQRNIFRQNKLYTQADEIKKTLLENNIEIFDISPSNTNWIYI